jgi:RNA polymerase sigma-70 factor, ECF subfamily
VHVTLQRYGTEWNLPMSDSQGPAFSELMLKARQGDAGCRDELFRLCRSYLELMARAQVESWLRVKVDASDLVQQTLLEAHRDFQRFRGGSQQEWLAWLRRILARNAADFVRHYRGVAKRQARREVRFAADSESGPHRGAPEPAAAEGTPSQEFLRFENELRVAAALGSLPPDYQEVVLLRNLQRLPFDEVARRMDRSRPAAQMLWLRALRKLRQLLAED